ncbi:MAG: acylneuraminate cytidylyltransferase family protein [Candidatus Micrarchaeia archaeon]
MKILSLILARGGSQRIPRKNIIPLGGKPLIQYTIEVAKKSKYINRIIVSTDDNEIAKVAKECGAEVPFMRPKEISQSDSTELQAFEHALKWLKENENYEPDYIVKLFPTSPFRKVESVDKCIELMLQNPDADSVRSVRKCTEHPYKMWKLDGKWLEPFIPWDQKPKEAHTLSYQMLPPVYVNNASIDITKPQTIYEKKSVTGTKIIGYVMDEIESIDINNTLDYKLAEILLKEGVVLKSDIK